MHLKPGDPVTIIRESNNSLSIVPNAVRSPKSSVIDNVAIPSSKSFIQVFCYCGFLFFLVENPPYAIRVAIVVNDNSILSPPIVEEFLLPVK